MGHDENCEYDCKDESCKDPTCNCDFMALRERWASLKRFVEMKHDTSDFEIIHGSNRSKRLARTRKSALKSVLEMMDKLEKGEV